MFRSRSRPPRVPSVEPKDVPLLLEQGALLVDIREQEEWEGARIAAAELHPLSLMETWYRDLPRDRLVILYCRSGSRSAHAALALIRGAGLDNLVNLTGGILAWEAAGLEVDTERPDPGTG